MKNEEIIARCEYIESKIINSIFADGHSVLLNDTRNMNMIMELIQHSWVYSTSHHFDNQPYELIDTGFHYTIKNYKENQKEIKKHLLDQKFDNKHPFSKAIQDAYRLKVL